MRPELFHPILVHFPIALLLTGAALRAVTFFMRKKKLHRTLLVASWIVLGIGVVFAWASVLAGEVADGVVGPTLCDRMVLSNHSTFAYCSAYLFSAALFIDWGRAWMEKRSITAMLIADLERALKRKRLRNAWLHKLVTIVNSLLYLAGAICLVWAGFLGGSLVYEQGAATESICK